MAFPTGWNYRKQLTDGNATAVTNFEVLIALTSSNFTFTRAQLNGSDIRVWDDTAGALVPHWIEEWDRNAQTARIWFLATDITHTHYLYYGNASATDTSDGDGVFQFFDDFGTRKQNEGTWEAVTDFPVATYQLCCEVLGNYLYAGGGGTGMGVSAFTSAFYRYDLTQGVGGSWELLTSIPVAVESPIMRAAGSKLYFMGGQDATTQLTGVYEYNPADDTWTTKTSMPVKREDMGSAVIGDRYIYLFGGRTPDFIAAVDIYDTQTDTWDTTTASDWPVPRQLGDLACAYNGKIYLVSGTNDMSQYSGSVLPHTRVDVYDPSNNTYTQKTSIPFGVCYKEVNAVDGKLYVIGGTRDNSVSATSYLQIYDIANDSWSYCTSRTKSHYGSAVYNGMIYVVAGSSGKQSGDPNVSVYRFTPNSSFVPSTAGGPLDGGKWTSTVSGTGGSATFIVNSAIRLYPTSSTTSSVSLVSVPTFTNNVIIELSRICSSSNYCHFGFGAGSLQDNAGGSANWWLTLLGDGYAVLGNAIQGSTPSALLVRVPAGGAYVSLADNNTVLDDGGRHRMMLSYTSGGVLTAKRNGTQWFTATNNTYLNNSKKLFVSQGEHSGGQGDMQALEWVFVRTFSATEPSITLGTEESLASSTAPIGVSELFGNIFDGIGAGSVVSPGRFVRGR